MLTPANYNRQTGKKIFYCFYYLKVFLNIRHVYVALNTTNTTKYNIVHFKKIKSAMN